MFVDSKNIFTFAAVINKHHSVVILKVKRL